jgi:hypothetical protein
VAWAEDCRVRGDVDLVEGRISDQLNDGGLLTFHGATLKSLDDSHAVVVEELEVERRELHLVEVEGRRGDPTRRLRTVEELVELQLGPFRVIGNVHRSPSAQPLAALSRWVRFIPVTDALVVVNGRGGDPLRMDVVLVNRDRVEKSEPLTVIPIHPDDDWSGAEAGPDAASGAAPDTRAAPNRPATGDQDGPGRGTAGETG